MGFLDNHPHTAVTSIINNCAERAEPDDDDFLIESQLSAILEAIKIQKDYSEPGPVEAARAIRKKLKYGSPKEQYNALKTLDLLVVNGSSKLSGLYNDDKLLDRLQHILASDGSTNSSGVTDVQPKVKKYAISIMSSWVSEYNDVDYMKNLVALYNRFSRGARQKKSVATRRYNSDVPDFMNDEADMSTTFDEEYDYPESSLSRRRISDSESELDVPYSSTSLSVSSSRPKTNRELDKKFKIPRIDYSKETPKILQIIAQANILSTNLQNILDSLDKNELSIHSVKSNEAFDKCRAIRRRILRYLQLVQKEELLGPLLKCNDDLVASLKKYEELSVPSDFRTKSSGDVDDDGDDNDYDSLADYESDDAQSSVSGSNQSVDNNGRYVREDPPLINSRRTENYSSNSTLSSNAVKRRPPPIPPKTSILLSPKIKPVEPNKPLRKAQDDYDPFSDENEVGPVSWG